MLEERLRNVVLLVDRDASSLQDVTTHLIEHQSPILANVMSYQMDPDSFPKHTLTIMTYMCVEHHWPPTTY